MLICCSRNISDYYQCWNCCAPSYFGGNRDTFCFSILWCIASSKHHLFEIEIFCIIINVFTLTSNQVNVSLLNNSIRFSQNKSIIAMLVYIFHLLYRSPWARQHQWTVREWWVLSFAFYLFYDFIPIAVEAKLTPNDCLQTSICISFVLECALEIPIFIMELQCH